MTVDVTTRTDIDRPRAEVAAYASDPDNATTWYENITSVRWESSPPAKVGSRIAFTARFLGRELAYTYEVRDIVADERFVMSTAQGPFPMETTYSWEDVPSGGTRMTLRNRGRPSGFSRIATPALAAAMRRANRKDLARLKAVLERRQEH
jgi:Polyketide cyclase / dehydrase and lipid transport